MKWSIIRWRLENHALAETIQRLYVCSVVVALPTVFTTAVVDLQYNSTS